MSAHGGPDEVTSGLVLALDAADIKSYPRTGTVWYDRSGLGNNGTLVNGVVYSGGSMVFDGVNDYVSIPYTSLLSPTSQITFGGWFYLNNWNISTDMRFISKTQSGGYLLGINANAFFDGSVGALIYAGGSYKFISIPRTLFSPFWHQIYITYKSTGELYMYLDGTLVDSKNVGANPVGYSDNNHLVIGAEAGSGTNVDGNYYNGRVSSLTIYNRALTPEEILQNFNAQKSRFNIATKFEFPPNTTSNYLILSLDASDPDSYSGTGTVWYDRSGFGNNFIISGPDFVSSDPKHFSLLDNQTDQIYNNNCTFLNGLTQMTASCWVRFDNANSYGALISYAISLSDNEYLLAYDGINKNFNTWFDSTLLNVAYTSIASNTWYNIVNVITATTNDLYINGQLISSAAKSGSAVLTGGGYMSIGQEQDSVGGGFDTNQELMGDIALVQIYNTALLAYEVLQNYNANKSRFGL